MERLVKVLMMRSLYVDENALLATTFDDPHPTLSYIVSTLMSHSITRYGLH